MSSATLYRWSGIILLVGGLVGLVDSLLSAVLYPGHSETAQQILSAPWLIVTSLFLVWALLLAISLPGFYLRQAARTGVLGFIGFALIWLGVLLGGVMFASGQLALFPYLAQSVPSGSAVVPQAPLLVFLLLVIGPLLLLFVGAILLGIATMRARVFPRWAGGLLLVAGIVGLISLPADILEPLWNVLFFLALMWFGYALVAQKKESVAAPDLSTPATQMGR